MVECFALPCSPSGETVRNCGSPPLFPRRFFH
jgi:hypothetical protein